MTYQKVSEFQKLLKKVVREKVKNGNLLPQDARGVRDAEFSIVVPAPGSQCR